MIDATFHAPSRLSRRRIYSLVRAAGFPPLRLGIVFVPASGCEGVGVEIAGSFVLPLRLVSLDVGAGIVDDIEEDDFLLRFVQESSEVAVTLALALALRVVGCEIARGTRKMGFVG